MLQNIEISESISVIVLPILQKKAFYILEKVKPGKILITIKSLKEAFKSEINDRS